MNTSRLLITTACSLALTGAASVAFAQTLTTPTTPTTPSSTTPNAYPNQVQGTGTGQTQVQTPATTITVPGSTTPGSINSTTQRPVEITTPMGGTTGNVGTTGSTAATRATGSSPTRATDGDMRTPADRMSGDRATVRTERTPRADRN